MQFSKWSMISKSQSTTITIPYYLLRILLQLKFFVFEPRLHLAYYWRSQLSLPSLALRGPHYRCLPWMGHLPLSAPRGFGMRGKGLRYRPDIFFHLASRSFVALSGPYASVPSTQGLLFVYSYLVPGFRTLHPNPWIFSRARHAVSRLRRTLPPPCVWIGFGFANPCCSWRRKPYSLSNESRIVRKFCNLSPRWSVFISSCLLPHFCSSHSSIILDAPCCIIVVSSMM